MKALVLAAGLGTRLAPFTNTKPKPAICVFGIPILYYSLFLLEQIHHRKIVVNLHHLPSDIKNLFNIPALKSFSTEFSMEKEKLLGSGGGIDHAHQFLKDSENFFVLNGDEVMIPPDSSVLQQLKEKHIESNSLATLLVTDHPDLLKTLKPVWIDRDGLVCGFGQTPPTNKTVTPVHFTGYKIYNRKIFDYLPQGESHIFKDAVIPAILKGEKVSTFRVNCQWWETGSFNNLLLTHQALIRLVHQQPQNNYLQKLYQFLDWDFDFKTQIGPRLSLASPSQLDLNKIKFENTVFIAPGSVIKDNIKLSDVITCRNANVSATAENTLFF